MRHSRRSSLGFKPAKYRRFSNKFRPVMLKRPLVVNIENELNKPNVAFNFSLTSYNVLAQYLIDLNYDLYNHCKTEFLPWELRSVNILREIKEINSDIVCLQEVQSEHFTKTIQPCLNEMGYTSLYTQKTKHKRDGCALAYRESALRLVDSFGLRYTKPDTPDSCPLSRSNNIAQLALFEPRQSLSVGDGGVERKHEADAKAEKTRFLVATTHLFFDPNRGDTKLAELCLLLAEMHRMATSGCKNGQHWPVILAGDFNAEPDSPLISDFLLGGCIYLAPSDQSDTTDEQSTGETEGERCLHKVSDLSGQNCTSFRRPRIQRLASASCLPPRNRGLNDACRFTDTETDEDVVDITIGQGRLTHPFRLETTHTYWMDGSLRKARKRHRSASSRNTKPSETDAQGKEREVEADETECEMEIRPNEFITQPLDANNRPNGRLVTSFTSADTCAVDYIMFANTPSAGSVGALGPRLQPLSHRMLVDAKTLMAVGGLPNATAGSDHIPLTVKFRLTPG